MKRILTLVLAVAAFLAAENTADAQLLKNLVNKVTSKTTETTTTTASTTDATVNGKAAGVALRALYTQYKADGKLDMATLIILLMLLHSQQMFRVSRVSQIRLRSIRISLQDLFLDQTTL